MSMTKAIPKPALMGGMIQKNMAGGSMRGKANSLGGGTSTACPACHKATKTVPTPKAM